MNVNKNYFKEFIGNSQVKKTLRNSLIPTEITKKYLMKNDIIKEDELRNKNRQLLKNIMDDYYRKFLIEKLNLMYDIEWTKLFTEIEKEFKHGNNKPNLEKEQKAKRKEINKYFSGDEKFKIIFSAKFISDILPEFVIHNNEYNADEKDEKLQLISLFSGFTTSLKNFFENRKNMFSAEDKQSSICHRIVNDNASIFFENVITYRKIKGSLSEDDFLRLENDIHEKLHGKSIDEIYAYDNYGRFITQDGINLYNDVCGRINLFMNLYCQQNNENKNVYKMRKLHKQILCIAESSYEVPYGFQSDEELYSSVNEFLNNLESKNIAERLRNIGQNYNKYELDKIYISSKNFETVSQKVYGDWNTIDSALEIYYTNTLPGSGKSKAEKVRKAIKNDLHKSITQINELVSEYKLCADEKVKVQDYIAAINDITKHCDIRSLEYNPDINLTENEDKASELKKSLDMIMNIFHWCSVFMTDEILDKDVDFYSEIEDIYDEIAPIIKLYNRARNYITQKPYSTEKFELKFGSPTFADGFSKSKEYANNAILLQKDGLLYLGVFNVKNKPDKKMIEGHDFEENTDYKKIVYNLLPRPHNMLPKVFITSKTGIETFKPSSYILEGYKQKKHLKSSNTFDINYCHDLIDYYKECIAIHPEWKNFNFKFSDTSKYEDISGFYREVLIQGYKIDWTFISEDNINQLQENGQLYLFKVYNKDFSQNSKGKENLHTMYLKYLFSDENLNDVVLMLNSYANVFYRKSSIKSPIIHKKGSMLINKTYAEEEKQEGKTVNVRKIVPDKVYMELYNHFNNNLGGTLSDEAQRIEKKVCHKATKDIIKDRRYTYDNFFINLPITINFKADESYAINHKMLQYISTQDDMHIIGIDRGERNLIYVSVIDTQGNIVEQKSFNIVGGYDYQDKLKKKENARQNARKEWKEVGKIKEIKEGYLSLVIHEIARMVIEYNAIIAMEDLSYGFKKGRFKVERQVYQKFETMLINKLNYLVFKDRKINENGGLLRGYQLTYIPQSLKNVGRQCGCIFYVPAAYTSKIDPTTGFADIFKFKNLTSEGKCEFIRSFEYIKYDSEREMFVFAFDYKNFATQNVEMAKNDWCVYTNGNRIKRKYVNGRFVNETDEIDINLLIKKSFEKIDISWQDGHDLRDEIIGYGIEAQIVDIFRMAVQMRNSRSEAEDRDYDRIISPVLNADGDFYESNKAVDVLPKDADANGAYCIALKGLYEVKQIQKNWKEGEKFPMDKLRITNKDWFDFVQNKRYL